MSIIGYILGLGDRHLENILLDFGSGQVRALKLFDNLFATAPALACICSSFSLSPLI